MSFQWLRRALLTAACVSPLLLAACGGGSVVSEFNPDRLVVFGDAFADAGQRGTRYTINNGGINWTEQLAASYGLSIQPSAGGGTSYAIGSARVSAKPDAAGNAATPTITEQIDAFLASQSPAGGDLIVLAGGVADVIAEGAALIAGNQDEAQATANVQAAGRALGAQVRRLVDAGATHVAVAGPYNLGRSPWARGAGREGVLETLTTRFNDELLISIVDLGAKVLYIDAALHINLVTADGGNATYGFDDVTSVLCTSVDAGPGIGIGAGRVNSALCNAGTLSGANLETTLFADPVYFAPKGHVTLGDYAYDRLRERW